VSEALAAYDRVVGLDLSEVSIDGRRSGCRGHRRLVPGAGMHLGRWARALSVSWDVMES